MDKTSIDWELYRSFLGVLTEGSLSGAARALGTTQPTVGRHIEALEKAFGASLFTRSQTGLMPTDAANDLRPYAQAMQSTAVALERAAQNLGATGEVRGVVRVSCSDVVGVEVLPALIAELCAAHPRLRIELVLTDRLQDLLHREADIAVRMARPVQDQLLARRVGPIEVGLYARRDSLRRRGTPRSLEQLAGHAIIGYDRPTEFIRKASATVKGFSRDLFTMRSDSNLAQLALIRAGAGVGMCQVPLARRDPGLVRLLPKRVSFPLESWITMHQDLRRQPRYRVTFDALVRTMLTHASTGSAHGDRSRGPSVDPPGESVT